MLRVDIRDLRRGPVRTDAVIPPGDPALAGLDAELTGPLRVSGTLEATAGDGFVWHGEFAGEVKANCRRCLKELVVPVAERVEVMFSPDPELQDDPSVYPLEEPLSAVDVTGAVREEFALAVAAYPLCREDCAGLCRVCGADLNQGPCGCAGSASR
ncbi:MAG: DUF177 domain-containing protein [Gemmatimonadales bacterium]